MDRVTGNDLYLWREKGKLSRTGAAELLGVARSTYTKWEDRDSREVPTYLADKFRAQLQAETPRMGSEMVV